MLEIWRQDAVYSFDFWPGAVVTPPTEIVFELEHARFSVGYMHAADWGFESARQVIEATERRVAARTSPSLPMVTSGIRSFKGRTGEAWSTSIGLREVGTVKHVIAYDMGKGLIAKLELDYESPPRSEPSIGVVESIARRIERIDSANLAPGEHELRYVLGGLQALIPKDWHPRPHVGATLEGEDHRWVRSHHVTFEFTTGPDAPAEWLKCPTIIQDRVFIDGSIVGGEHLRTTFSSGSATASAWAALPAPDDEDPDEVEAEAVAALQWPCGKACKLTALQEIEHPMFERARDLARLRDLVLRIGASSRCRLRSPA